MSLSAAQRQRAVHLYRHSLKNILSWAIRRDVFWEEVRPRLLACSMPPACSPAR